MRHYFIPSEQTESFSFDVEYAGRKFSFSSSNDMFSKDKLDEGSKVLLDAVLSDVIGDDNADVLDLGCGLGVIGIILATAKPNVIVDMSDINSAAIRLARENVQKNKVTNIRSVIESDAFENVQRKYKYIVTNPPIKAGKENLFNMIASSKEYLLDGGEITCVIRKKHGEESLKKLMEEVFGNCKILKRDKGYYILSSRK